MYLLVREEPSRVTFHPDGALVAEDKASLDQRRNPCAAGQKRWIPEPESRAFPKTPDQRFLRESAGTFDLKRRTGQLWLGYRVERTREGSESRVRWRRV